jgi:hypothetical protein
MMFERASSRKFLRTWSAASFVTPFITLFITLSYY